MKIIFNIRFTQHVQQSGNAGKRPKRVAQVIYWLFFLTAPNSNPIENVLPKSAWQVHSSKPAENISKHTDTEPWRDSITQSRKDTTGGNAFVARGLADDLK